MIAYAKRFGHFDIAENYESGLLLKMLHQLIDIRSWIISIIKHIKENVFFLSFGSINQFAPFTEIKCQSWIHRDRNFFPNQFFDDFLPSLFSNRNGIVCTNLLRYLLSQLLRDLIHSKT